MIFSIPLLVVAFLSLAPYVSCQAPATNKTLMEALAGIPECKEYYGLLQKYPEAQIPPPGPNYLVYCPRNEAVISKLAVPSGNKVKRGPWEDAQGIAMQTAVGPSVTKEASTTRGRRSAPPPNPSADSDPAAGVQQKRQVTNVFTSLVTVVSSSPTTTKTSSVTPGSSPGGSPTTPTVVATGLSTFPPDTFALDPNQVTLKTLVKDPALVNLGPGESARMVSSGPSNSQLVGGHGDSISVLGSGTPFDRGIIYIVQGFVTLPDSMSQSLIQLGQNIFLAALRKYNLLSVFEITPRISAFVPIDSSLSGDLSECACKQHIVEGPLLYTPDIELGRPYTTKAGGNITIEIKNGQYTLPGGATIVKANIITKNGVVHLISKPINGSCDPSSPKPFTGGSDNMRVWVGGLFGLVGVVVGFLA